MSSARSAASRAILWALWALIAHGCDDGPSQAAIAPDGGTLDATVGARDARSGPRDAQVGDAAALDAEPGPRPDAADEPDGPPPPPRCAPPRVLINEVVAANRSGLPDEDGERPDWIELHNASGEPVRLLGWALTDDPDEPEKWSLPDETLAPDAFMIVFASGEDRPGPPAHASFKVSADGETLVLTAPGPCEADRLQTRALPDDVSLGRVPGDDEAVEYFLAPTPGRANDTPSRPGLARVALLPTPGYHPAGTAIRIVASPPGARVHYTLDGSPPDTDDPVYADDPIVLAGPEEGRVLRAIATADDAWPAPVVSGSYFAGEPPSIATVALVTDPAHFFDPETGIYVLGDDYEAGYPHFGANFWEDWERPVYVALWEDGGRPGFAIDAGVKIHGRWSRAQRQRSLRIMTRGEYGTAWLEHPVFGADARLPDRFKRLLLRNSGQDWAGCQDGRCEHFRSHLRDLVTHRISADIGVAAMAGRPARVYINGVYWGLHNLRERIDRRYIEARTGDTDIELLEVAPEGLQGESAHYAALLELLRTEDLAQPAVWARVQAMMDTDDFAAYCIAQIFHDNHDWPGNNVKLWRPRTEAGRWRWMMFDTDFGLGWHNPDPATDTIAHAQNTAPRWPPAWSTELFRLVIRSPSFRADFINRFADALNTVFRPEHTRDVLARAAAAIEPEMPRHLERWGFDGRPGAQQLPAWRQEIAAIDAWFAARTGHVWNHLAANFGLGATYALTLGVEPPGGGRLQLTGASVQGPFTGTYFRDVPVRVTAVPAPGFEFVGWSEAALGPERTLRLSPDGDLAVTAIFEAR